MEAMKGIGSRARGGGISLRPERGSISNQNGIENRKPEAEEAFPSDAFYFLVEVGDKVIG